MGRTYILYIGATILTAASLAAGAATPTLAERKEKIKAMQAKVAPEALQRKRKSETHLKAADVPVNDHLPVIETAIEITPRSKEEVAYRALALLVVALKSEGLEQPTLERIVKEYELEPHFTPKEQAFLKDPAPKRQDRVQFSWRYEAAWTLLWALSYVQSLEKPSSICDVPRAVTIMKEKNSKTFVAEAKLRALPEVLDQADRIYRYHWAVVDARINGKQTPAGLNPGVTYERHYALNRLIRYMNQDWDDISTDT